MCLWAQLAKHHINKTLWHLHACIAWSILAHKQLTRPHCSMLSHALILEPEPSEPSGVAHELAALLGRKHSPHTLLLLLLL